MRLLLLPYGPTLSHVSRLVSIATRLRTRGVEIVFGGSGPEMARAAQEGFPVLPLWEPAQDELFGALRQRRLRFVTGEVLDRMVRADLELFQEVRPSAVVSDGRFSAPISTKTASVPHGAVVNASSTRFRAIPYLPPFASLEARWPRLGPALVALECTLFDRFMGVFRAVARDHGVPGATTPTDCLTGRDLTLLPDLPEFFPTRNLPGSYHYVGPLTWRPAGEALPPVRFSSGDGSAPRIYLTFGTTGDDTVLRRACEVLASRFRVVVTTAGRAPGLAHAVADATVVDYADGDELCSQADVVVCHGGNGTIYQALRHGTPIVGIPFIPDQEYNMRRVEALGLGRRVGPKELLGRPDALLEAATSLAADKQTRERCRRFGEKVQASSGPERAADLVARHLLA